MAHPSLIREDLVPSWNASRPKYMEFLRLVLGVADDFRKLLDGYPEAFSVDSAAGAQLDIVGEWLGVSRILSFAPASQGASRRLSDDDFRLLIRAQIARNAWDGTNAAAHSIFSTVFPSFGIVLQDGQDASINVILSGTFSDVQLEMINAGLLIPHPAGVLMTYEIPHTITVGTTLIQAGVYMAGEIGVSPAVRPSASSGQANT